MLHARPPLVTLMACNSLQPTVGPLVTVVADELALAAVAAERCVSRRRNIRVAVDMSGGAAFTACVLQTFPRLRACARLD